MSRAIVVVPCYNEANRLDAVRFQEFSAAHPAIEFLFLNDGSTDGTLGVLERLHAVDPTRFRFVHLSRNSGKAEAVRRGMLAALGESPDYVGFWDADLATPLDEIPHFCRVLDEHPALGIVIGSRLRLLGPPHRPHARCGTCWAGCLPISPESCSASASTTRSAAPSCFGPIERAPPCLPIRFGALDFRRRALCPARRGQSSVRRSPVWNTWSMSIRWTAGATSPARNSRPHDFVWSLVELARIYWTYLRPGFASPAVTARLAGAGHLPEAAVRSPLVAPPAKPGVDSPPSRRAA